jgi:hypothetical protein
MTEFAETAYRHLRDVAPDRAKPLVIMYDMLLCAFFHEQECKTKLGQANSSEKSSDYKPRHTFPATISELGKFFTWLGGGEWWLRTFRTPSLGTSPAQVAELVKQQRNDRWWDRQRSVQMLKSTLSRHFDNEKFPHAKKIEMTLERWQANPWGMYGERIEPKIEKTKDDR